jgi:hypothetical protein
MKINQLFNKLVEEELTILLLKCVHINGFDDNRTFTKNDMKIYDSVQFFELNILDELKKYYLPCKAKVYLTNLNEKKLITIIKQVLKLSNYNLVSIEKNKNNKKCISYKLSKLASINNFDNNDNTIVNFD